MLRRMPMSRTFSMTMRISVETMFSAATMTMRPMARKSSTRSMRRALKNSALEPMRSRTR